ncbi:MAG TPA: ABC transporter permease [Blastocatellia bacterium]|nr:ABC transporter permease [Blastocatellia bacterium]
MNFADIIALALRNLRQAKLRTALTVIGVIVGVAAIVTMVSFGIGLQRNIIGQAFSRLDAFTSITVVGADTDDLLAMNEGRTAIDDGEEEPEAEPSPTPAAAASANRPERPRRSLNDEAIAEIKALDGVKFAAPIVTFNCYTRFNSRTRFQTIAGATAAADPRFKTFLAGGSFQNDNAEEAVINENFISAFSPEAFRRRRNRRGGPPNGGPFQTLPTKTDEERQRAAQAVLGQEITLLSQPGASGESGSIFGIPLFGAPSAGDLSNGDDSRYEKRAFRIVGVLKNEGGISFGPFGNAGFYLPMEQAKGLRDANLSPMERMGATLTGQSGYRAVELRVADPSRIKPVTEKLEQLGFRAFSVTNQLEEIERIFLIVNSSLALIGGIALLVASFGISNTMIMSIRERTREIGIMKAIGGSDGEIMRIFFVEASLIGLLGGVLGVLSGWGIDRLANVLANRWIVRQTGQAVRYVEFFSIPWYLWGGAILFAVMVSLLAAIYPAMRAAKVDPIKALRHE